MNIRIKAKSFFNKSYTKYNIKQLDLKIKKKLYSLPFFDGIKMSIFLRKYIMISLKSLWFCGPWTSYATMV